ncbi:aldehyde dehydrogenase (NADP(+)) [Nonomuraea lactucae]|uniref:aldehyde dehydrogenase (NADP(+)) n=1 Tax=Nonomuraea lactucae TaxID=2249762 RepID=UPI000DE2B9C1|nr:aldehyde dehydrogenase (NADP(+)) [Nonomuraea lactucae]
MIYGYDPRTGEPVGGGLCETGGGGVGVIVDAAVAAGEGWRATAAAGRAVVLEAVADALVGRVDELWRVADRETALGEVRLRGEVARAAGQFRLFAQVIRDGGYLGAVVDHADSSAMPPRPDVRRMRHPLAGVVAVFAASNFPFAFSVAGGDTASALAAGCPVVVKAHPAHPNTSECVARVVREVLPCAELLGLVHGVGAGVELVRHRGVVAVGFTGSVAGGRAIRALIEEREVPIPFFGELGSVNPVVVLPSAARAEVAAGFAASLTLGVGQFCTNPGLVFVPDDDELREALAAAVERTTGGPMLAERIRDGYLGGLERLGRLGRLAVLAEGESGEGAWAVAPRVFAADLETFADGLPGIAEECFGPAALVVTYRDVGDLPPAVLAEGRAGQGAWAVTPRVFAADLETFADGLPGIAEECFGPAALVVTYRDVGDLPPVLERLEGSLTATVHGADPGEAGEVVRVLGGKAGRLVWNGWPTGVAVCWAMHHGGPWPASTAPAHTSVGATAIDRWLAPRAYQDWPAELLPDELKDGNPLGIPRRVDGVLTIS